MIKQNFTTKVYPLKRFKDEYSEVAYAGDMNSNNVIVLYPRSIINL